MIRLFAAPTDETALVGVKLPLSQTDALRCDLNHLVV